MDAQAGMLARLFEHSMGLGPEWRVEDVWFELCLVKSCFRKRASLSFGFRHASFSVFGAGTPLAS